MAVAALTLGGLAACGDETHQRDCAPGTVPDPDPTKNECIPDGSVICGNGTTYDPTSGKCVAGGQCPTGQMLVNGTCTATVTPDAEEAAEPNDTTTAGTIMVPDVGANGYVVHGCITPHADHTADLDPWTVTVTQPTLLDVTAAGVGGLAAGFVAVPQAKALVTNGWQRYGINLTDTTSHRQLFLPTAGTYQIILADSRQLLLQEAAAGTDKSCYYTTVTQLAIPTPTPVSGAQTTGTIGGEVKFYSVTQSDGELFFPSLALDSGAAEPSIVAQINGDYFLSNDIAPNTATPNSAGFRFGGEKASDQIVFVVDTNVNYAIQPVGFTLDVLAQTATALPTTQTTITQGDGVFDHFDDVRFFWFDAQAGDVMHLNVAFTDAANFMIVDSKLDFAGFTGTVNQIPNLGDTASVTASFDGWYHFTATGRYYLAVFDPNLAAGATTMMTVAKANATVATMTVGTPVTNHALDTSNASFLSFDPSAQTWITATASGTGFGGNIQVDYFPSTGAGLFGADFARTFGQNFTPTTAQNHGRITYNDPATYIVRVSDDSGTAAAGTKFTLSEALQTFTNLGTVSETAPVTKTGEDLGGTGKKKLYFVRAAQGDTLTITVHPTINSFNPSVTRLDVNEGGTAVNAAGAGADEVVTVSAPAAGWVALAISGTGPTTTYNLSITAVAPVPYTMSSGTLAYSDNCNGTANAVTMNGGNDEGLSDPQTMPFAFSLFGDHVTTYTISTNGWLAFGAAPDPAPTNVSMPSEGTPNGVVAPFWTDLAGVTVCQTADANKVTVQWNGFTFFGFGPPAQMQVVLHKDGTIDYIYGAQQQDDGADATVGLENLYGTFGNQVGFNAAATVAPSTSFTFTPMP